MAGPRVTVRRAASTTPRAASRGTTQADVDRAADTLLRAGERPTIEKVRAKIGRGSPNTINPLLDVWWQRLADRLDAGPAALHRLPEAVAHAAEGLWMQALSDARVRVAMETHSTHRGLARAKQDLAVQTHVLAIRESELRERVAAAERRARRLEIEVETLTTMLRKEQASRRSAARSPRAARDATSRDTMPVRRTKPLRADSGRSARR